MGKSATTRSTTWYGQFLHNFYLNNRKKQKKINDEFSIWFRLIERPEEPYDSRSLFERLKEQRDKKDLEFEESHKLSKCSVHLLF